MNFFNKFLELHPSLLVSWSHGLFVLKAGHDLVANLWKLYLKSLFKILRSPWDKKTKKLGWDWGSLFSISDSNNGRLMLNMIWLKIYETCIDGSWCSKLFMIWLQIYENLIQKSFKSTEMFRWIVKIHSKGLCDNRTLFFKCHNFWTIAPILKI